MDMIIIGRVYRITKENDHPINRRLYEPFNTGQTDTKNKWEGLVYITSGQAGDSNFWYWKRVLADGSLSEETYHGYGGGWERVECDIKISVSIRTPSNHLIAEMHCTIDNNGPCGVCRTAYRRIARQEAS